MSNQGRGDLLLSNNELTLAAANRQEAAIRRFKEEAVGARLRGTDLLHASTRDLPSSSTWYQE